MTATLALSLASNELTFVVTDDGQGTMSADAEAGHGLENMRERMAQLGGSCSLESAPTGGLKVIFRVPLTGEDQAL